MNYTPTRGHLGCLPVNAVATTVTALVRTWEPATPDAGGHWVWQVTVGLFGSFTG